MVSSISLPSFSSPCSLPSLMTNTHLLLWFNINHEHRHDHVRGQLLHLLGISIFITYLWMLHRIVTIIWPTTSDLVVKNVVKITLKSSKVKLPFGQSYLPWSTKARSPSTGLRSTFVFFPVLLGGDWAHRDLFKDMIDSVKTFLRWMSWDRQDAWVWTLLGPSSRPATNYLTSPFTPDIKLDPGFKEFLDWARSVNVPVVIVSR